MIGAVERQARPNRWTHVREAYGTGVVDSGREPAFILTLAFLLTFAIVRLTTHAIKNDWLPFLHDVSAGSTHVHHMVPGVILALSAGYLAVVLGSRAPHRLLAALFGIGAALVLDEFALLLQLADVYWDPQGRESIDAVIIAGGICVLGFLGTSFWPHVGHAVFRSHLDHH